MSGLRNRRLPSEVLNKVDSRHIWEAIQYLKKNQSYGSFSESRKFDLIVDDNLTLAPKAVFGKALEIATGIKAEPKHFTGGIDTICFNSLTRAGYKIVKKGAKPPTERIPQIPEEKLWLEGNPKLVAHLRRERHVGLVPA